MKPQAWGVADAGWPSLHLTESEAREAATEAGGNARVVPLWTAEAMAERVEEWTNDRTYATESPNGDAYRAACLLIADRIRSLSETRTPGGET